MVTKTKISWSKIVVSLIFFLVAGLCEIGDRYLIWLSIRQKKRIIFGGIVLFTYGIIPTLQPSNFGRVYVAYRDFLLFLLKY